LKICKQRRLEIKKKRRDKAFAIENAKRYPNLNFVRRYNYIEADHNELSHNNTYGLLPIYYVDKFFYCKECDTQEVWTAKQQKWWYETAKGHIDSTAVHCKNCRNAIKNKKAQQKEHMRQMAMRIPHPNEAFFKKTK